MSRHTEAPLIDHDALVLSLSYDKDTGIFHWRRDMSSKVKTGDIAGNLMKNSGYWQIVLNYKHYRAHRLAWFYVYKIWPLGALDHINMVRSDNRIENLRPCSISQNGANSVRNGFLPKGVDLLPSNRYRARFRARGEQIHLGVFDTPELANEAYFEKAVEIFGEFARK